MSLDAQSGPERTVGTLDPSVTARLRSTAARLRALVLVEGAARLAALLLLAALVQLALDYGLHGLRWSMRAALLAMIVVGATWMIRRQIVTPLSRRIGPAQIANLVERRYPHLSSLLISGVRFSTGQVGPPDANSPALMASVVARAGEQAGRIDFGSVVDPRRARWSVALLAAVFVIAVGMTATAPQTVGLWFTRNVLLQEVPWPKRTHLIVELDGDELVAARGDDVVIEAHAAGVQPRAVDIVYRTATGRRGRETTVTIGSRGAYRYRHTFNSAREDLVFHLQGGDDRTPDYRVRLLDRPRVTRTQMSIEPPAYARLDPMTYGDGQRATQVLPGTRVALRVETNKPVATAVLMAGDRRVGDAMPEEGALVARFVPPDTHTYHFALVDDFGLENRRPMLFAIRVMPDEPPRVRMRLPDVGDMITPEAVLPIELEFTDTYGLAEGSLHYEISREETERGVIPLATFEPYALRFATTVSWPVATAGLVPGDILTLQARASDFDDVSGPNEAESPQTTVRVVTREELLAELARREQESRADFEHVVDVQEQVRGGLLTALARLQNSGDGPSVLADLAPLERRQRNIAGSVNVIRQQFERILGELAVNQLDTRDERERLGEGIIAPLTRLTRRDLISAADVIGRWSREMTPAGASAIDPQQVALLSQMRAVLSRMIQWEGYQELISMLRDIIRLQRALQTETKDVLQKQAGDVFDD
jgi:hypothetical protein